MSLFCKTLTSNTAATPGVWVKAAFVALIGLLLCSHVFPRRLSGYFAKERIEDVDGNFDFFVRGTIVWYSVCYDLNTRTWRLCV